MGSSKIVNDVLASATWMSQALASSGYRADFSLASLSEIDRFFDEQAPNGNPKAGGIMSENLGSIVFGLGSYVGEALRKNLGGEWIGDDNDPQAEINVSLKLGDGSIVWPIQRVMKRLRNGREDGIAAYGAALNSRR